MKNNFHFLKTCLVAAIAIAVSEGCSREAVQDGPISTLGTSDTTNTIGILSDRFSRPDHWIGRNYPVTWVNRDDKVHSVTADDGSWSSGPLQPGTSYSKAFSDVGAYGYHDDYSGARGTINVFGRDE